MVTDPHYTRIREDVLSDLGWTEEQAANYSLTELQQILGGDPTSHIRRMLPKVDSMVSDASNVDARLTSVETIANNAQTAANAAIPAAQKGAANGVVPLDANGIPLVKGSPLIAPVVQSTSTGLTPPVGTPANTPVLFTAKWDVIADIPASVYGFGCATDLNGRIYVISGTDNTFTNVNTVYRYDPATGLWSTMAPLPGVARADIEAFSDAQGRIFAVGGYDGSVYQASMYRYDPGTNAWTAVASMPAGKGNFAVTKDLAGLVYIIGGYSGGTTMYRYDPVANTWATMTALPVSKTDHTAVTDPTGRIHVIGGADYSATVYTYTVATNTWATNVIAPAPEGLRYPSAVTDSYGRMYLLGGINTNNVSKKTVYRYDFGSERWVSLPLMPTDLQRLGVALDLQGRVYALGGWVDGPGPSASCYRYLPPPPGINIWNGTSLVSNY